MKGFLAAQALLPPALRTAAEGMGAVECRLCEEFRFRRGRPPTALIGGREKALCAEPVSDTTLRAVLENATRSSLHAAEAQLRRGYIAAPGGVRVGVCGTAVTEDGRVTGLRDFSSAAVRIPREVPGCAGELWPGLISGGFESLLIIAPPGAGKTTLLRELIRRLSRTGARVCVADERGELAGCVRGEPSFDLGPCADVMTEAPRAEAVGMLLRSMSPQVLAMDEITEAGDGAALLSAAGCGVTLLATIHGADPAEVSRRPVCRALLEAGAFRRYVLILREDEKRRYTMGAFSQ